MTNNSCGVFGRPSLCARNRIGATVVAGGPKKPARDYALECALKACIAKGTQRHEFPDKGKVVASYSHNSADLVKLTGLEDTRRERARQDEEFRTKWEVVQKWSKQSRYR